MIKNIRMLAFDLDDTALDGQGRLAPETREAFIAAAEAGIEPVIASGRSFYSLPEDLLDIPGVNYAICSNGANLFNVKTKECMEAFFLEPESVEQIVALADDYLDTLLANDKISEHRKKYLRKTRRAEDDIRSFIREHKTELDCMNYNVFDTSLFEELTGRLKKEVENIYFTSSIPELIEISFRESGKGPGLRRMCDYLNIPLENVAAFGNADNDAEMIRLAGVGYAVANSSQVALDAADIIIGPCWENSVASAIQDIVAADGFVG